MKKGGNKSETSQTAALDCQRIQEAAVPTPGASAQELQILCRSFAKCLVEKGHGYRQLMEAACHLLDQAMEELSGETQEGEEKPATKATASRASASEAAKYNSASPPQA